MLFEAARPVIGPSPNAVLHAGRFEASCRFYVDLFARPGPASQRLRCGPE